jgi:hypothetical protein
VFLERRHGRWQAALPEKINIYQTRKPQKVQGLQGPIDDAFTAPFLCVRGTRTPWHQATEKYASANLERFRKEWSKYFRGELPVKDDDEVDALDMATRHLILFGDPSSNSLIGQLLDGLPFTWAKDKITWDGKDYSASNHVPVLIYPSPFSTLHYIVLNSGHTFHAEDFRGTNALLYPRLGDYAILKVTNDNKNEKNDPLSVEVERRTILSPSKSRRPDCSMTSGGSLRKRNENVFNVWASAFAEGILFVWRRMKPTVRALPGRNCITTHLPVSPDQGAFRADALG